MSDIFISYSHRDEVWMNQVLAQLRAVPGLSARAWHDRELAGGDDWRGQIAQAITECKIALLLISAHFLTSEFIRDHELPPLLARHKRGELRLLPVIVRDCPWQTHDWLGALQIRPTDAQPLNGMSESQAERALRLLAEEVNRLLTPSPVGASLLAIERSHTEQPSHREQARSYDAAPAVELNHLPDGAPQLFGRAGELAQLDDAWASNGQVRVFNLIAPGGTGKTALLREWLTHLAADDWRGARRVYAWSFYSQGSSDDRQASEDGFLDQACRWFGLEVKDNAPAAEKGAALAKALAAQRGLLILDGLEPLQYPPGQHAAGLAGQLRAPGLRALLQKLGQQPGPSLCLVSSREHVADLSGYVRNPQNPKRPVVSLDLNNLAPADGAQLLHAAGAQRAGEADIGPDDKELLEVSKALDHHALSLNLLGRYLHLAHGGNIRPWAEVNWQEADQEAGKPGHAFRVIGAYEHWFAQQGAEGARELAVLRLLGLFDRPAPATSIQALRAEPVIAGLTDSLQGLSTAQWRITLTRLRDARLLLGEGETLDAHPLVREYFAHRLQTQQPEAWREGHRRLYHHLTTTTPKFPDTLEGLQPLYQAVGHGCKAGLVQEACEKVYRDRILRGTGDDGFYSWQKLGAFGANLGVLAYFFIEPWRKLSPTLTQSNQAWLLNETAIQLRALGRPSEALEPMWVETQMAVPQKNWNNVTRGYINLSELQLTLGRVTEAITNARQAVSHADRSSDDAFLREICRTILSNALHQGGKREAAQALFEEAEELQQKRQPEYPLLYSLRGFQYCELLLAPVERTRWRGRRKGDNATALLNQLQAIAQRAQQTLQWAKKYLGPLDVALDHLTLARCALYADLLQHQAPGQEAQKHSQAALSGLRASGSQHHIPRGLLTRALLDHALGRTTEAHADLDEAEDIARRGGMKLFLADIALHRARLFADREALAEARRLIEACGYGRRLEELEDVEDAFKTKKQPAKLAVFEATKLTD